MKVYVMLNWSSRNIHPVIVDVFETLEAAMKSKPHCNFRQMAYMPTRWVADYFEEDEDDCVLICYGIEEMEVKT